MVIEVNNSTLEDIKILPTSEHEEIAQNVKTILTTTEGEVFLDRTFGVATELLDLPMPVVKNKLTAKICDAVNKFEPRAKVTDCFFGGDGEDGRFDITVRLKIIEKNLRGD